MVGLAYDSDESDQGWSTQTIVFDTVPEPATIGLLGLGALITMLIRRVRPSYR